MKPVRDAHDRRNNRVGKLGSRCDYRYARATRAYRAARKCLPAWRRQLAGAYSVRDAIDLDQYPGAPRQACARKMAGREARGIRRAARAQVDPERRVAEPRRSGKARI